MVRIMKKDGNRLEGIGERIAVRLTLLEEALGMTPGDPEIYGNWIASKAPEPEVGEEEVGVIEGMDTVEDATTCFPRTEDGVPFCWDYQIKGFFKDACSSLRMEERQALGCRHSEGDVRRGDLLPCAEDRRQWGLFLGHELLEAIGAAWEGHRKTGGPSLACGGFAACRRYGGYYIPTILAL